MRERHIAVDFSSSREDLFVYHLVALLTASTIDGVIHLCLNVRTCFSVRAPRVFLHCKRRQTKRLVLSRHHEQMLNIACLHALDLRDNR